MSFSSSVPRLEASCSAARPVRLSRSIASWPKLKLPVEAGQSIRPRASRPRSSAMPLMVSSVAGHSPRISEPRLNSTSSFSARTLPRSLAPPTVTERNCSEGAGRSRASSLPATRTGAPTIRVASASNCGRNWLQSMKYGATSAATNAMMKVIASPSSVVCTVSPLGCHRARPHPGAGTPGNIETSVAESQRHHAGRRSLFGRVFFTRTGTHPAIQVRDRLRLKTLWEVLPACRQPHQAAQHEGRAPLRVLRVIQPQVGDAAQQGRDRDLGLDARELGAEAEMDAAAEGKRLDRKSTRLNSSHLGISYAVF